MKTEPFVELVYSLKIRPKTIYDIGAFDCSQSLELSEAFPDAAIYAFEPVPENFNICAKKTSQYKHVHPLMIALGDRSGQTKFHKSTSQNKECGSLLEPNGKYWELMPTEVITVDLKRIDDLSLPVPDVIWMDVQGNELSVLRGMGERINHLCAFWSEVTYKAYYQNQMLAEQFHDEVLKLGFRKVYESTAMPGWFGDAAYARV